MTIIEQNICVIESLNHQGLGTGQTAKGSVELPFTLPGESVKFTRHNYRGKSNCTLNEIITPSPNRMEPFCNYFGRCGGCLLQHLDRQIYKKFKINLIQHELNKANINTNIKPLIIIDQDQRRRVNLQFVKKKDQIYLGYYRFHSHQIVNIESCPSSLKEISDLITHLKQILAIALANDHKGQVFITKAINGIDMMLELRIIDSIDQEKLRRFAEYNNLLRFTIKAGNHQQTIYQKQTPYVEFGDIKVEINYSSFLQANFAADKILFDLVAQYIPSHKDKIKILDLFCGRGTFTFPLRKYGIIDGFELDKAAVNSALEAVCDNKLTSINFFVRDLFTNFLSKKELNDYDFAIINPPRKGAIEQITAISQSQVHDIVYVSCNPQSFVRDAKILISNNYTLKEVTPLDQFYQTSHLEAVGFFTKNQ